MIFRRKQNISWYFKALIKFIIFSLISLKIIVKILRKCWTDWNKHQKYFNRNRLQIFWSRLILMFLFMCLFFSVIYYYLQVLILWRFKLFSISKTTGSNSKLLLLLENPITDESYSLNKIPLPPIRVRSQWKMLQKHLNQLYNRI